MLILIILDGFGLSDSKEFNAVYSSSMPNWDKLIKDYAFGSIQASSKFVGLPNEQFGNSEVGHLIIGSGRNVQQDITRIDMSILDDSLSHNINLNNSIKNNTSGTFHLLGMLSDGGVHGHIDHLIFLIKYLESQPKINKTLLHIFLDGRDVAPKSAKIYYDYLKQATIGCNKLQLATVIGRFYAMDRDNRFDRTKLTYDLIMGGVTPNIVSDFDELINLEYTKGTTDEFVPPYKINAYSGISCGDTVLFTNFRSDRAVQLTKAFVDNNFNAFPTNRALAEFMTMTVYDKNLTVKVLFEQELIKNTLGDIIAKNNLSQLRIAETEKYQHITYFFNGRHRTKSKNEDWILIPSPQNIATYDLMPEMSLPEVTNTIIDKIEEGKYDIIVTNFANADMVGHSGSFNATVKALEYIDLSLGKIVDKALGKGWQIIVTADHGNCEEMFNLTTNQPITQHTTNPVPFLYIGKKAKIRINGSLKDIAPTILDILSIKKPDEMDGESLVEFI